MEELIAELLLLARGEAVLLDRHETVPLAAIVDEAVDQCRLRLDERGVRALVDVPDNVRVDAAPQLLARALRNLVDNAAKVSPPGDNILICGRQENGHALVTVEDHGPGIAPEHQPHIFEPFYQVAAAHTPGESHGLGLAICRFIVAAHGGTVTLQSIPGQGTNFRIELPASEPEPISARVAAREQEAVTH
jgi:signal transduction histidine kinase